MATPDVNNCRRIVTGIGSDGRSKAISDAPSPHVKESLGYINFAEQWLTPSPPPVEGEAFDDLAAGAPETLEPADPNGTLLRTTVYQPDPPHWTLENAMHASKTIDYVFCLFGEMVCIFEDGEVTMKQGDVMIQRGTQHAWSNRSGKPAMIGFVMMGATDHGQGLEGDAHGL
jgi:hypothetical protein